jgi:hypothetical protein
VSPFRSRRRTVRKGLSAFGRCRNHPPVTCIWLQGLRPNPTWPEIQLVPVRGGGPEWRCTPLQVKQHVQNVDMEMVTIPREGVTAGPEAHVIEIDESGDRIVQVVTVDSRCLRAPRPSTLLARFASLPDQFVAACRRPRELPRKTTGLGKSSDTATAGSSSISRSVPRPRSPCCAKRASVRMSPLDQRSVCNPRGGGGAAQARCARRG